MPRVKTPALVPVPAPVEVSPPPATAETMKLTPGEMAQASLQTISDLVRPAPDESVVDAVRRALSTPAPAPAPAPAPTEDSDTSIRRILGHLLGIGPSEATAVQMATMLSRKIRGG